MFDEKFLTQKLDKFVALLDINSVVEYDFVEEKECFYVKVFFKGDNLGYAIGFRGKNIQSMQYILSMMLKAILRTEEKNTDEEIDKLRVVLDIGDYREQHVQKLRRMVESKVDDVRALGEYIDLEPMHSSDRREIHLYIESFEDMTTESVGEGRDRAIRIIPVENEF